jgi:hypothetical protein
VVGAILEGGRVIETGDRIGQTTALAHVAKVVPEMLSWFEFDFFFQQGRVSHWLPPKENVPGPHNAPVEFVSNEPISLMLPGSVVNWSSKSGFQVIVRGAAAEEISLVCRRRAATA